MPQPSAEAFIESWNDAAAGRACVHAFIENREKGGLGTYLVKQQMNQVIYEYTGGKNRLTIVKETA